MPATSTTPTRCTTGSPRRNRESSARKFMRNSLAPSRCGVPTPETLSHVSRWQFTNQAHPLATQWASCLVRRLQLLTWTVTHFIVIRQYVWATQRQMKDGRRTCAWVIYRSRMSPCLAPVMLSILIWSVSSKTLREQKVSQSTSPLRSSSRTMLASALFDRTSIWPCQAQKTETI